jgi:hypothetical protein
MNRRTPQYRHRQQGTEGLTEAEHHDLRRQLHRQQLRQNQDNERRMQIQTTNRMNQLFEENDHKRCSDGNTKALLAEELESLRRLVNQIEKDDWQYKMQNSSELLAMHHDSNYFADAPPG